MTANRNEIEPGAPEIESGTSYPALFENLRVAAPCPANWLSMTGDDKKRFCSDCKQNVYNLSAMSTSEAEELIASQFGKRLCVRFFKRRDGTLISRNCPVGLRQLRHQGQKLLRIVSSLIGFLLSGFASVAYSEPVSKVTGTDSKAESAKVLENNQDAPPPYFDDSADMGMLDWNTVKEFAQKHEQAYAQTRRETKNALRNRALQLKNEHPQTTADKVALSKFHIDIANQYYFLKDYKEAAEEYESAARLLKNIEAEKELCDSVVSSVQLCRDSQKKTEEHKNKKH